GSLPPGGMAHTRYLVARVRSRFPDLKLIIGRWGRDEQVPDEPAAAGRAQADWVDMTLAATRKRLNEWHSVFTAGAGPADAGGEPDGKTRILGTAGASTR